MTPRSKTVSEVRQEGISPPRAPKLKKKLVLHNALIEGIKETKNQKRGKKLISLRKIISGKVLKKYRCARFFSAQTGIERRSLKLTSKKPRPHAAGVSQATTERDELKKLVITFLKRGDNSHQLPGKRDSIKVKENTTFESHKCRIQEYILSDYLSNLFLKFQAEYPDEKISFSTFCRIRPSYMKLLSFSTGKTCLCQYHQNLSLELTAIKAMKIEKVSINPDSFIRVFQSDKEISDLLETIPSDDNVDY